MSRRAVLLPVLLAILLGGCATGTPAGPARRDLAVVRALPAGTTLRLLPVAVVGADGTRSAAFDGLLREALRQTVRFDIAASIEDGPSPFVIGFHHDVAGATVTSTLLVEGEPPTPLAAAAVAPGRLTDTADALALATRIALGEPDATAVPTARGYSTVSACIEHTEAALSALATGAMSEARARLGDARAADAGCTITLLALAELDLRDGEYARAEGLARDALQFTNRCLATTSHRLARAVLLAQAATGVATKVAETDQTLLALGEAAMLERPADPHARWTRAQALNLLGRFAEAEPLLAALELRWPHIAQVGYHRALALLGLQRPEPALAVLDAIATRLPALLIAIPRAIALWAAGRDADLEAYLADLRERPEVRDSGVLHHVLRMQASHAILRGRDGDAVKSLLTDMEWLRQRTSRLERHATEIAATGQVLVLLGHADAAARAVSGFERLPHVDVAARRAITFVAGLIEVARQRQPARTAEAALSREGESAWSHALRAAAHRQRLEVAEETRELLAAIKLDRSAILRASLLRALRTTGEDAAAKDLGVALAAELTTLDLRRLSEHPLLDPANALALLATRQ